MRLIQCHIENFGKLHDLTIDFNEGLNHFCKQNGWGKSTLGAFLRVMLYGFEGETKRNNLLENERKRYEPWQGGVYGGSLTFSVEGKEYIVNRVFKDKAANDIFQLRDGKTNLESSDFSANLGEEIFKINSEAFLRTGFIKQQDCMTVTNDSIHAKIGNLTDNTNDLNNYETADAALKDILNKLNPRVKRGAIHQLNEEITRLKTEVSNGKTLDASIQAVGKYYDEAISSLEELKSQKVQIVKKQEELSRYQDILVKKETYDLLCKEETEKEVLLKESLMKFPHGVPKEAEIKEALEQCASLERMLSAQKVGHFTDAEQKEYVFLSRIFEKESLKPETMADCLEQAKNIDAEERRRDDHRMTREEEEKYFAEKEFFGCENPSEAINHLQHRWSERGILKGTISMQQVSVDSQKRQHSAAVAQWKKQSSQKKWMGLMGVVLGVGSAVLFVILSIFPALIASVLIALAGVILLVVSGKKMETSLEEDTLLEAELLANKQRVEETEREVELYLARHNITYDEERVLIQLQQLLTRGLVFENLVDKYKKHTSGDAGEVLRKKETLDEFLMPYREILADCMCYADRITRLMQKWELYGNLQEKEERNTTVKEGLLIVRQELSGFLQTYGLADIKEELLRNTLQHLLEQVTVHKILVDGHSAAYSKKEEFKKLHNMEELLASDADTEGISLQELQEQFSLIDERTEEVRNQIKTYEDQLDQLQEQHDEWMVTKELLERKEAEVKHQKEQYALLEKTREYLGKAKEELTLRYTGPIMEHFLHYYSIVTGEQTEDYKMDANIRLTVKEQGLQRETNLLSTGYQDLIGVCLRLALIEAMYTDEKPMLVMDDPFVNLDEEKATGSGRLLKELSERYQILYFTCK